ncbi:MAG: pantothenate kinase [Chloroflexi bacterium RBG_13_51_52]|nr:MAG: pantothenate kinase [Chloroflexi bacterium RBG_13_51_52]
MLLVFDIANTNIKIGMFEGDKLKATWRISTGVQRMADEYAVILLNLLRHQGIDSKDIKEGAMSCVVPPLVTTFNDLFERYFKIKPLVVGPGIKTGVRIRIDDPRSVGADLIANAAAAMTLYKPPIIVVALGTATAFAIVSRDGYLGGVIAPGLGISAEALYTRTAALPRVELAKPKKAIGSNTQAAMQSGLIFGWAGLIEGIVNRIHKELGEKATVVATGGYAGIIAKETKAIDEVNPHLTLIGIKAIHDMNRE